MKSWHQLVALEYGAGWQWMWALEGGGAPPGFMSQSHVGAPSWQGWPLTLSRKSWARERDLGGLMSLLEGGWDSQGPTLKGLTLPHGHVEPGMAQAI